MSVQDNGTDNLRGARHTLRALRRRNYRLYFIGHGASLIGTWMQSVAFSWLVYEMTGSAFLLGVVGFASQIPSLLLSPIGGAYADRLDRRKLLIATQSLAMLQAFALAALVLTDVVRIWHVIALTAFSGLIFGFDAPTRQSFVVEMTETKDDLANAIALNSSLFNGARLIGPSIGGLIIAAAGTGMCFLLNGISFIAVIASLLAMRIAPRKKPDEIRPIWSGIAEGFTYAAGFKPIANILLLIALFALVGMPYAVLLPIFAGPILHSGATGLGILMASAGLGAFCGAISLARRRTVVGLERRMAIAGCAFGAGLIAFSLSHTLWLSSAILVICGFGMMNVMVSGNTIIQTIVDEDKRGRVMSLFTMAFMGPAPFGSLLAGALAQHIGPPITVALGGSLCIVGAILFATELSSKGV